MTRNSNKARTDPRLFRKETGLKKLMKTSMELSCPPITVGKTDKLLERLRTVHKTPHVTTGDEEHPSI